MTVRRAPRRAKASLSAVHREPQPDSGELSGLAYMGHYPRDHGEYQHKLGLRAMKNLTILAETCLRYSSNGAFMTLARRVFDTTTIEAILGDLTDESTDVIVNAANSRLMHGGGLAGAIVRSGGATIQAESDLVAPVPVGGAAATGSGSLPCRWVVHAVGPRWGEGDEEPKLRSAVRSALDVSAGLGAVSVAMPAISTGIFGYPKESGTHTIVEEVEIWIQKNPSSCISTIRLVAFDKPTSDLFAEAIKKRF